jgi:hypothetical protein
MPPEFVVKIDQLKLKKREISFFVTERTG